MKKTERVAPKKYELCENLPGFAEVRARLEAGGHPSAWITDVVDTTDPYAMFLKKGKTNYKSACPHYEGYWLHGGTGSVQCKATDGLLPGLQYTLHCEKNCEACKFYKETSLTGG